MAAMFPKRQELEREISDISNAVARRKETDKVIPLYLGVVPIALFIAIIITIALVTGMFSDILASSEDYDINQFHDDYIGLLITIIPFELAFYPYFAVISYLLVVRNNNHFARDAELSSSMVRFVDQAMIKSGQGMQRLGQRPSPWDYQWDAAMTSFNARQRHPLFWALVVLLQGVSATASSLVILLSNTSILGLSILNSLLSLALAAMTVYMWYFLMTCNREHDKTWTRNAEWFKVSLAKLGYTAGSIPSPREQPERSFVLYFVLSLATGMFVFYWWYVLVKDPNEHYHEHAECEDEMPEGAGRPSGLGHRFGFEAVIR